VLRILTKYDIALILFLLFFSIGSFIYSFPADTGGSAEVFIDNQLVKKISLAVDKVYEFQGVLSSVKVEVREGKVGVIASACPLHLCLKQGKISQQGQIIVCLPNRLLIVITAGERQAVDGIVG
jgi:hypothetical protein